MVSFAEDKEKFLKFTKGKTAMKKKILAVLLCVSLLLTLSVGVSADGLSVAPDTDTQIINTKALQPVSEQGNATRSETSEIVSGAVYRIKNVGSGKYMNVHYGNDANGKYTKYDLENGLIPEEIETKEILCGLDSYCVVGDGDAVVKH